MMAESWERRRRPILCPQIVSRCSILAASSDNSVALLRRRLCRVVAPSLFPVQDARDFLRVVVLRAARRRRFSHSKRANALRFCSGWCSLVSSFGFVARRRVRRACRTRHHRPGANARSSRRRRQNCCSHSKVFGPILMTHFPLLEMMNDDAMMRPSSLSIAVASDIVPNPPASRRRHRNNAKANEKRFYAERKKWWNFPGETKRAKGIVCTVTGSIPTENERGRRVCSRAHKDVKKAKVCFRRDECV